MLSRTRRDQGEVPFALDGDGNIYTASPEDEAILTELGVDELGNSSDISTRMAFRKDWLVVASPDPDSEVVMGIARPLAASLSAMRTNAARNFGLGLPDVRGAIQYLALQVRQLDVIELHQAQTSHTGRREIQGRRRSQTTAPNQQNACRQQLLLPLLAKLGKA